MFSLPLTDAQCLTTVLDSALDCPHYTTWCPNMCHVKRYFKVHEGNLLPLSPSHTFITLPSAKGRAGEPMRQAAFGSSVSELSLTSRSSQQYRRVERITHPDSGNGNALFVKEAHFVVNDVSAHSGCDCHTKGDFFTLAADPPLSHN